jgi:hypothetical protein
MRSKYRMWLTGFFFPASSLLLLLPPSALAQPIVWYVDGVNGNDANHCQAAQAACKTIGHAISLASSGDSIIVAAATYTESLTIGISLNIIGSGSSTTIIDGGGKQRVLYISQGNVNLSGVTIRNGFAQRSGGGILNAGTLSVTASTISGNKAVVGFCLYRQICTAVGGGISNGNSLTISDSTLVGNSAEGLVMHFGGNCSIFNNYCLAYGGGIFNQGKMMISNSTLADNSAWSGSGGACCGGGGIFNQGSAIVSNSTLSGNSGRGSDIFNNTGSNIILQNSIVDKGYSGENCYGTITSNGHNLSSDGTCNFNSAGDLNNHDPLLGALQSNGGTTQTMALGSGSPAIDAGNPGGCTDGKGNLLKTDQRGMPRPDPEDVGGCDVGAFESQRD